jgi:thiamine pyrophosphokinase
VTTTFVIVAGGAAPHPGVVDRLPDDRTVIAADSGLDHALALGLDVELIVGDLDSVSAAALAAATEHGVPVERHPTEKDAIDLELAIDAALERDACRILVLSGGGDRLDQVLAGLLLLADPRLQGVTVEAWMGTAHVLALRGPMHAPVHGRTGELVSLVPVGGDAHGITTSGLRYPLHAEPLLAGATRGISNEIVADPVGVELERGTLLVIRPYALLASP